MRGCILVFDAVLSTAGIGLAAQQAHAGTPTTQACQQSKTPGQEAADEARDPSSVSRRCETPLFDPDRNNVLLFTYVPLMAWAGAYWGRYRYAIARDSKMDRVLGGMNVFSNALLAILATALPITTGFVGIPALGFAASATFLFSLYLYRVRIPDVRLAFAINGGRRVLPTDQQFGTRWPYTVVYTVGHGFMFAYVATIITLL